jgi:hypothetical protein
MINSYNVLINKANIEQIVLSGVGFFFHSQDDKDAKISIEFMIKYFQDIEMYEKCSALKKYIEENFNEALCVCEYPDIKEYSPTPKCSLCNMRMKRL